MLREEIVKKVEDIQIYIDLANTQEIKEIFIYLKKVGNQILNEGTTGPEVVEDWNDIVEQSIETIKESLSRKYDPELFEAINDINVVSEDLIERNSNIIERRKLIDTIEKNRGLDEDSIERDIQKSKHNLQLSKKDARKSKKLSLNATFEKANILNAVIHEQELRERQSEIDELTIQRKVNEIQDKKDKENRDIRLSNVINPPEEKTTGIARLFKRKKKEDTSVFQMLDKDRQRA